VTGTSWQGWLFAVAAVAAAGIVRGFSGFGAGLVMVPSLSLVFGPAVAVPVVVAMEVAGSALLVPTALRDVRWRAILPLALAAGVTIPLGGTLLASIDGLTMRRAISAVVLVFTLLLWTGWRYGGRPSPPVICATGATSGLLTGAAGIGGPPVILFFLSGPHGAPDTRANLICFFAFTQLVAIGSFAFYGLLGPGILRLALVLVPVFLLAAWAGSRWFVQVSEAGFRRATLTLLVVIALVGLLRGGGNAG
jgi:uncharacterized membrane protein YfcA